MRILCSGSPVTRDMTNRAMCGFCVVYQTVRSPEPLLYRATTARGSIAFGMSRWLTKRCARTMPSRSASLNAAAVASLFPMIHLNARLLGTSAWSCGAPGAIAFCWSTTAGRGSYSTRTSAAASRAANRSSATTTATPSPA